MSDKQWCPGMSNGARYAGVVAANDGNTGQAGGQGALLQLVWLTATAASVNAGRRYRR